MTRKRIREFYTLRDINYAGKTVLLRTDYNTPLNEDGSISDNSRIKASLKSIRFLIDKGAKIIIISHLGRPNGKIIDSLRMDAAAAELSRLLGREVYKLDEIYSRDVKGFVKEMKKGEIVLLENIRFDPREETGDYDFAKKLSSLGDLYVNDAFSVCHRDHSSISKLPLFMPGAAGYLFEEEIRDLKILFDPKRPFIWVLGGAKIKDKMPAINYLGRRADEILIGGRIALSFLAAAGFKTKAKITELTKAREIFRTYKNKLLLPVDLIQSDDIDNPGKIENNSIKDMDPELYAPDIGKRTVQIFKKHIKDAKTILWTGPLGIIESRVFSKGSIEIARFISDLDTIKIVGGGDTDKIIDCLSLNDKMTYISRSGGAMIHYIGREKLPGIESLNKSFKKF